MKAHELLKLENQEGDKVIEDGEPLAASEERVCECEEERRVEPLQACASAEKFMEKLPQFDEELSKQKQEAEAAGDVNSAHTQWISCSFKAFADFQLLMETLLNVSLFLKTELHPHCCIKIPVESSIMYWFYRFGVLFMFLICF